MMWLVFRDFIVYAYFPWNSIIPSIIALFMGVWVLRRKWSEGSRSMRVVTWMAIWSIICAVEYLHSRDIIGSAIIATVSVVFTVVASYVLMKIILSHKNKATYKCIKIMLIAFGLLSCICYIFYLIPRNIAPNAVIEKIEYSIFDEETGETINTTIVDDKEIKDVIEFLKRCKIINNIYTGKSARSFDIEMYIQGQEDPITYTLFRKTILYSGNRKYLVSYDMYKYLLARAKRDRVLSCPVLPKNSIPTKN